MVIGEIRICGSIFWVMARSSEQDAATFFLAQSVEAAGKYYLVFRGTKDLGTGQVTVNLFHRISIESYFIKSLTPKAETLNPKP